MSATATQRKAALLTSRAQLVLHALAEPDEEGRHTATVDGLAQLLRCGRGAVIAVLDELVAIGYAVRSEDRRMVELTPKALTALRRAREEAEREAESEASANSFEAIAQAAAEAAA